MIIALQTLVFFRDSVLGILNQLLQAYFAKFGLSLTRQIEDEDDGDEVYADFDDEKGVIFYPPMYAQRYAAVTDCLLDERWCGTLEKVVDLGYHDMNFIKYLKEVPGVKSILGVDIESIPLRCSSDLLCEDYSPARENPLQVTLFQGNAADPDYRLIGCDAVVAIEMIEHMLPHDLDRIVHTIFGFIKPRIVVITTPNGDFNVLFKSLESNGFRRLDHFFEWSREQFHDWCSNIVTRYPNFNVTCKGIGPGPSGTEQLGCCSQLALFINKTYYKQKDLDIDSLALVKRLPSRESLDLVSGWDTPSDTTTICPNKLNCTTLHVRKFSKATLNLMERNKIDSLIHTREVVDEIRHLTNMLNFNREDSIMNQNGYIWYNINWGDNAPYWNQYYKVVRTYNYPFEVKSEDSRIIDVVSQEINRICDIQYAEGGTLPKTELQIPLDYLMRSLRHITDDKDKVREILDWNGYEVAGDFVMHNRIVVEKGSDVSDEDWPDLDEPTEVNNFST